MLNPTIAIATLTQMQPANKVVSLYKPHQNQQFASNSSVGSDKFEKILAQVERQMQRDGSVKAMT